MHRLHVPVDAAARLAQAHFSRSLHGAQQLPALRREALPEQLRRLEAEELAAVFARFPGILKTRPRARFARFERAGDFNGGYAPGHFRLLSTSEKKSSINRSGDSNRYGSSCPLT